MNEQQAMVRTISKLQVIAPKARINFQHHVWQTPISRYAPVVHQPEFSAAWQKIVPVWVYVTARRILGDGFYERMKSALRGER